MKQIAEDYVSFEIAQLLEEKGFDGDCDYWYDEYGERCCSPSVISVECWCPSQSLALKWLREVHNWYIDIRFNRYYQYYIPIVYNMSGTLESIANLEERPKQYEQAVEVEILYVLKNLI